MTDAGSIPASALLDAMFANEAVGLVVWDTELRFRRVNERLAAMNGVPLHAHVGRRPSEVLPELGERLEALLGRVLATGEGLRDVELSGETPAAVGVRRHWLAQYFPVRNGGGEIAGVGGLVVEITAERHAQDRADSAMERTAFMDAELQALYAALPVGVAFLSPDLRYQRVNETLARLNGLPVERARRCVARGCRSGRTRPCCALAGARGDHARSRWSWSSRSLFHMTPRTGASSRRRSSRSSTATSGCSASAASSAT